MARARKETPLEKDQFCFYRPDRRRVQFNCVGESMTKQSFRDEVNVNNIMRKYRESGLLTHVNEHQGRYGDFLSAPDYHTAMNSVVKAQEMFDELPADIRKQFANDPMLFLEYVQDPENEDGMRELGLLPERPKEEAPDGGQEPSEAAQPGGGADDAEGVSEPPESS